MSIEVIEHDMLRLITGIDCSTPRCAANAVATGRLVRGHLPAPFDEDTQWNLEIRCPDCGDTYTRRSSRIQALATTALEPPSTDREMRIATMVEQIRRGRKGA